MKLNALTGKDYHLPTEAEWEYAARGGRYSHDYVYSGGNEERQYATYDKTHLVGSRQANELGIYDMSGNVWEWCQDWYDCYDDSPQNNPQGPSSGSCRVYRGGSWYGYMENCSVSRRGYNNPDSFKDKFLGFRLACSSE